MSFSGTVTETIENAVAAEIGGEVAVYLDRMFNNGAIIQWLILGPYTQSGSDSPGPIRMTRDYLKDGAGIDEAGVLPEDGDTVATNFTVAASTGYLPAGETPTWRSYMQVDPANDLIDFNVIWASVGGGDPNNVMAYAVCYVENTTGSPLDCNVETSSNDSIEVLIGNCAVLVNSVPRGVVGFGSTRTRRR